MRMDDWREVTRATFSQASKSFSQATWRGWSLLELEERDTYPTPAMPVRRLFHEKADSYRLGIRSFQGKMIKAILLLRADE